jgi:hypothetical protein
VAESKIAWRRRAPMARIIGSTNQRSSGMAVSRIAEKSLSAMGNSCRLT